MISLLPEGGGERGRRGRKVRRHKAIKSIVIMDCYDTRRKLRAEKGSDGGREEKANVPGME